MNPKRLITILILLISLICAYRGVAMSLFFGGEKAEAVLFSPLEGQLTFNGKPAAGAKIKLWLAWKDQEGESEYFTTDDNGYFTIPKKTVMYKKNPLAQISIGQTLTVEYNNQQVLIWKAGKTSIHLYGELGGRPEGITCELTRDEMDAYLEKSLLETTCVWKHLNKDMEKKDV